MNKKKGFTLLEMLLVIAIISILAGIVIVAINPVKQIADAKNTERASNLKAAHNAINQYLIDNNEFPETVPDTLTEVCDTGNIEGDPDAAGNDYSGLDCDSFGLVDLSILVPTYLSEIPVDPDGPIASSIVDTAYADPAGAGWLVGDLSGKIIVVAPLTQNISSADDIVIQYGTTTLTAADVGSPYADEDDGYY